MKKKAYISPAVNIHIINMKDGIMLSLSDTGASNDSIMEVKDGGDWDIWGNGSDSDYDDEY